MFAAGLFFERDELKLDDLLPGLQSYVVNAGLLVAIVLLFYLVLSPLLAQDRSGSKTPGWVRSGFKLFVALAILAYAAYGLAFVVQKTAAGTGQHRRTIFRIAENALTFGGGFALLAVLLPFAANIPTFRVRRIWALARLSFKEAIRRKVLWVFLALLLVLLFASWFIQSNPADQVRTYVQVVSFSMAVLLLLVAGLLASFGIPTDMKQQTIHTVITKPVERFEIVVGRFLGYVALLTLVLVVVSGVSLLYVLRGIDPDAAKQSLKARETKYGALEFEGTKDRNQATNVGKEWGYRSYIPGPAPQEPTVYAVWKFTDVAGLKDRKKVRCEFGFDIYRTNKGTINEGVLCTFIVQSAGFDPGQKQAYDNERKKEREKPGANYEEIDDRLAEKYGCYEVASLEIRNLPPYPPLDIPGGLFRHAADHPAPRPASPSPSYVERPPVAVRVRCESRHQYVGVAKHDLYLRPDYDYDMSEEAAAKRDRARFVWNYAKGQIGLWLRLCLVVGLGVSVSTCLSGIISFLAAAFIYLGGILREFIKSVAEGTSYTGGPFEAGYRLAMRDLSGQMEETSGFKFVAVSDEAYRWVVRLFVNVLPDMDRFDLSAKVAEGFNIGGGQLTMTALLMASYLLLCALGAFYLMKSREIAANM
jgi:hypothetical protein